jgi:hypothetical protein
VGVLGCLAACAGLLGIEGPSDRGAIGDAGDGAVPDGDVVADAPVVADVEGLADGGAVDGAGGDPPLKGVRCGTDLCELGLVCCYQSATKPLGCMNVGLCATMAGGRVACDGDEDCAGKVCCASLGNGPADFVTDCVDGACSGARPCHTAATEPSCNCLPSGNRCLPFTTCDGRCN